jgi:hypothetical protein
MQKIFYFLMLLFLLMACKQNDPKEIADNTKVIEDAETIVLMHNPSGVRLEYNIDRQSFDMWISPKAGESLDYFDRNFSCRDDYTSVFDKVTLPGLKIDEFVRCEYDPFYSKVIFENQVLHIATLFDNPVFIIWFDNQDKVWIKAENEDIPVERSKHLFAVKHSDRGYDFQMVARMSEGEGIFRHQLQIDEGRSIYTEAGLAGGQKLIFGSELEETDVLAMTHSLANQNVHSLLKETNKKVDEIVKYGRPVIKDNPDLQKLMDLNRRIWVSMQDHSGAIRASIKNIYYLIWVRDGGMATSFNAYAGWLSPLEKWTEFQLHNPTEIEDEEPKGRFFGQLVNGKITKWEEDGLFYALWSAFTHWTQTGNEKFVSGENLDLLKDATDWLERYAYDDSMKLFFRYHYCETPLKGSRGYHWDNAVGKPVDWEPAKYEGEDIVKSYDVYINMISYASYMMLASMTEGAESDAYLQKALSLEKEMKIFFPEDQMPYYGKLLTDKGEWLMAPDYGMDHTDYLWALSLPPFKPAYFDWKNIGDNLLDTLIVSPQGQFLAGYFAVHSSLDAGEFNQEKMMQAMEYAGKQSYRASKYMPMAYSIIEMLDVPDGDPWHDIRPQPFSMGAWFSAVANYGVDRMPFGLAVRPAEHLAEVSDYVFQESLIDFEYKGAGNIHEILIDGEILPNTWQIPANALSQKDVTVEVLMKENELTVPVLVESTIELMSVQAENNQIKYKIKAYSSNHLRFKNVQSNQIKLYNQKNKEVGFDVVDAPTDDTEIRFSGKGVFTIVIDL